MIIQGSTLKLGLEVELGFPRVMTVRDRSYFAPARSWLGKFAKLLAKNPPVEYARESFDCDEFAMWAVLEASKALYRNPDLRGRVSHTLIQAWLRIGSGLNGIPGPGAHATILCYCNDEEWYWLEPQNGKITKHDESLLGGAIEQLLVAYP